MILLGFNKTSVNGKQFTVDDSRGTLYLSNFNLDDTFHGGMVKEFRKTDYGIYLCLDKKKNIINLMYVEDELTSKGKELLFGVEEEAQIAPINEDRPLHELDRKELMTLAKELGVEGKIATMKGEELKNKIQAKLAEKLREEIKNEEEV